MITLESIKTVNIELNNICNLSCTLCQRNNPEMGEGYANNLDTLPNIYFWEEHIYRNPTNDVDLKLTFYKVKKYFKQLGQIWI